MQTINGFDLLMLLTGTALGIKIGANLEKTKALELMRDYWHWVQGESIESQMHRDGWEFPTITGHKKK